MPEFHKNQVRWEAPEAQKVNLAKPDYSYLQGALDNLARAGDAIADTERQVLDDRLKADLDEQLNLANQDIEDARSATADFDSLGEKALSRIQGTLGQYDEATQRRFLNANPHYLDNTQLAIQEKILKRKRDIFETDVENNLPLWTSQAAMIGTSQARQDVIHKIQESLGNISYETTVDNMIFKANQMFDRYNIARLISSGTPESLAEASRLLKTPELTVTIDPYQRVQFEKDINSTLKELTKQSEAAKKPQGAALVEAYRKLRVFGLQGDADYLYEQVAQGYGDVAKTTTGEYALTIDGQPLPLYLSLQGLNQTERLEIAKEMKKLDKEDLGFLSRTIDYSLRTDDLLKQYTIGYDNKDASQSEAVAGLEDVMNNVRMFQELPTEKQKEVRRIVTQSRNAKTEIMTFDSTPFRDVGWLEENAARVIPEVTAGGYLRTAVGPQMTPVPEHMRTRNTTMENLLNMSLVSGPTSPVERDIYKAQMTGSDMAEYINYAETKGGDSLVNAVLPLRSMFYKNVEDNTIGEYVLLTWQAMAIMQKQGMLDGTRFYADLGTYTDMFDRVMGKLEADGTINDRTTDEAAKQVTAIVQSMAGPGAKLTEYEQRVLRAIEDGAAGSQVNRKARWFRNWWNKNFERDTRTMHIPDDALPSAEWQALGLAMETNSDTKQTRKAIKTVNKSTKE